MQYNIYIYILKHGIPYSIATSGFILGVYLRKSSVEPSSVLSVRWSNKIGNYNVVVQGFGYSYGPTNSYMFMGLFHHIYNHIFWSYITAFRAITIWVSMTKTDFKFVDPEQSPVTVTKLAWPQSWSRQRSSTNQMQGTDWLKKLSSTVGAEKIARIIHSLLIW